MEFWAENCLFLVAFSPLQILRRADMPSPDLVRKSQPTPKPFHTLMPHTCGCLQHPTKVGRWASKPRDLMLYGEVPAWGLYMPSVSQIYGASTWHGGGAPPRGGEGHRCQHKAKGGLTS